MSKRASVGVAVVAAVLGLEGCEGYSVSFGTTVDQSPGGAFYQIYEVPATSVRPWSERGKVAVSPPPDGEASGATTLPAGKGSAGSMPPEPPAK
jgi:hypothetical protein